jgi:hypothetical protein
VQVAGYHTLSVSNLRNSTARPQPVHTKHADHRGAFYPLAVQYAGRTYRDGSQRTASPLRGDDRPGLDSQPVNTPHVAVRHTSRCALPCRGAKYRQDLPRRVTTHREPVARDDRPGLDSQPVNTPHVAVRHTSRYVTHRGALYPVAVQNTGRTYRDGSQRTASPLRGDDRPGLDSRG